jgi:hypothetical protein
VKNSDIKVRIVKLVKSVRKAGIPKKNAQSSNPWKTIRNWKT